MSESALRGVAANLLAGARVALFLRVSIGRFRVDARQLLLFLVVSALIDCATDWVRFGPDAVLDASAVGAELASFALLVAIAALLAWLFANAGLVVMLPIVVLASMPLVQVANLALEFVPRPEDAPAWTGDVLHYMLLGWFLAVLWRSTHLCLASSSVRAARATAGAALLALPLLLPDGVVPTASWWQPRGDPVAIDAHNAAAEPVLALQRELQDEALNAIEEHTPGETDLYFVGFAGDGDASTWRPRMERAKQAMDAHWGTSGRSLVYLNDASTLTESPMATITHLREALDTIASVADPDEDIVMLYLGGRANADGTLTVSLPPLGLVQLSGTGLSHLLVQAGIRYSIVVIAACQPRAFVDALADESTVVLASSADACGDETAPTALGDLLFGETLSGATSLRSALETAQRRASARGGPATLHVGASIAPLLARVRVPASNRTSLSPPWRG